MAQNFSGYFSPHPYTKNVIHSSLLAVAVECGNWWQMTGVHVVYSVARKPADVWQNPGRELWFSEPVAALWQWTIAADGSYSASSRTVATGRSLRNGSVLPTTTVAWPSSSASQQGQRPSARTRSTTPNACQFLAFFFVPRRLLSRPIGLHWCAEVASHRHSTHVDLWPIRSCIANRAVLLKHENV